MAPLTRGLDDSLQDDDDLELLRVDAPLGEVVEGALGVDDVADGERGHQEQLVRPGAEPHVQLQLIQGQEFPLRSLPGLRATRREREAGAPRPWKCPKPAWTRLGVTWDSGIPAHGMGFKSLATQTLPAPGFHRVESGVKDNVVLGDSANPGKQGGLQGGRKSWNPRKFGLEKPSKVVSKHSQHCPSSPGATSMALKSLQECDSSPALGSCANT